MQRTRRLLGIICLGAGLSGALLGCGPGEGKAPEPTADQKQKMDDYNKAVMDAEAQGKDPSTIPAPK